MNTFDQFIEKYKGKFLEAGGSANAINQCVDLVNGYISEVLGLPKILGTNAQDFPSRAGDKYEYILNTPNGIPKKGNIIIWKSADRVGHIAVFVSGDEFTFTSFDQNWPTGSPCTLVKHNYTNVLGWLKVKGEIMADCLLTNTEENRKKYEELVGKASKLDEMAKDGYKSLEDIRGKIASLEQQLKGRDETLGSLNQTISNKNDQISVLNGQISSQSERLLELQGRLESLTEQAKKLPQLQTEYDYLLEQRTQWQKTEQTYNRTIGQLKAENEELRAGVFKALFDVIITNIKEKLEGIFLKPSKK